MVITSPAHARISGEIKRLGASNVVEVPFTDENPKKAARFVNELLVHHVKRIASLGESPGAHSFYGKQADLLAKKWEETNDALIASRRKHGANVSENEIHRILSMLESQRVDTETQSLELEATIDFLAQQIQGVPETVASGLLEKRDESVGLIKSRLLELKIERIVLLSTYTPDSKVVRDLDRQIEDLQSLLTSNEGQIIAETTTELNPSHQVLEVQLLQTETKLNAIQARLKALNKQIAGYKQKLGPRVGKILRKSRLDELPQLWNILIGEMSLVGPRPERPPFVEELCKQSAFYDQRHEVEPGLTGWAQIMAPYASSIDESLEKLEYDLFYIKNMSLFLDLSILASTARIVFLGRGAR